MSSPHHAGELREQIAFQRRSNDANGDPLGDWVGVFVRSTKVMNLRGGEAVMQQRIQGKQPAILVVRACPETRALDNSFRAVNERTGQVYELSAASEATDQRWMEVLAVAEFGNRV